MKKNLSTIFIPLIFLISIVAGVCSFLVNIDLTRAESLYKNIETDTTLTSISKDFDSSVAFPLRVVILQEIASATLSLQGRTAAPLPFISTVTDSLVAFNTEYPQFFQIHLALARLYDQWGVTAGQKDKFTLAQKEYEIALKMVPGHQEILYPYAFNIYYRGDIKKALSIMEEAYQAGPHVVSTEYFYGMLLINDGEKQYDRALGLMEDAFTQGFDPPEINVFEAAYGRLFLHYYKLAKFDEFKKVVNRLATVKNSQIDMFKEVKRYVDEKGKIPVLNIKVQ